MDDEQKGCPNVADLNREARRWIERYDEGKATRAQLNWWAGHQQLKVPDWIFSESSAGELVEYVLARMLDDWLPDDEWRPELADLHARLKAAVTGQVVLP